MRSALISILVVLASAGSPFGGTASADEAYVCEGGRVAYVRFGQLEAMKRKDPCIAAYYGGTPEEVSDETDDSVADAGAGSTQDAGLPVVRTAGSRVQAGPRAAPAAVQKMPVLKESPRLAVPPATAASRKVAARQAPPRAPAPLPVAHPDTDFRNVRVLNAGVGESAIFKHAR